MFKTKINRSQKTHLITGKPVSAVLLHFVFSSPPHCTRWKKRFYCGLSFSNHPLSMELFRLFRKRFYHREFVSFLSRIKISLHTNL